MLANRVFAFMALVSSLLALVSSQSDPCHSAHADQKSCLADTKLVAAVPGVNVRQYHPHAILKLMLLDYHLVFIRARMLLQVFFAVSKNIEEPPAVYYL